MEQYTNNNSEQCIPIGPFPIGCHTELISEKDIEFILSQYNFFNLEWKDDAETTRLQVPETLRRSGLWITYTHLGERITERFIGTDMQAQIPEDWKNDVFWEKLDFEAILNSAEDAFTTILRNLDKYPKFKEFLSKLLGDLLKNEISLDDLKDLIELHIEEVLKSMIPSGYLNALVLSVAQSLIDNYLNSPSFKATLNKLIQDYLCNLSIGDDIINNYFNSTRGKEVLKEVVRELLEEILGDYFEDIQNTLTSMERVIANALARHELAITELQNQVAELQRH